MNEACSLPDLQNRPDSRGIPLERVGISGVTFPIRVMTKACVEQKSMHNVQSTAAKVDLFVGLPEHKKGVNMSRFMETLLEFSNVSITSANTLPKLVALLNEKMKSQDAYVRFEFDYFIDKISPVSKITAPMGYRCAFIAMQQGDKYTFMLEVNVVAASLCPCSREMSLVDNLNYENIVWPASDDPEHAAFTKKLFADASIAGLSAQVGMGAHNQRSLIRVRTVCDHQDFIWIEDLVALIESQASAPTYPILKRPDEKFATELAYNNAKFTEDIARDIQVALERQANVQEWSVRVSNEESIHPYNATTYQRSAGWKF